MANKTATLSCNLQYTDEDGKIQTNRTITSSCPYQSQSVGTVDIVSETSGGTSYEIPFGEVSRAYLIVIDNQTSQPIDVSVNGGDAPVCRVSPSARYVSQALTNVSYDPVVASVSITTTEDQETTQLVSYKIFGDPEGASAGDFSDPSLRSDWYVDLAGSDLNDGTESSPLQTLAAWRRRLGSKRINPEGGTVTLHLGAGIFPDTDPLYTDISLASDVNFVVKGTKTVLDPSTFTDVQSRSRPDNIPNAVTNSAASTDDYWTQYQGYKVYATSGVASGARACIRKDLGTKQAKLSTWLMNSTEEDAGEFDMGPSEFVPEIGDSYEVCTFTEVTFAQAQSDTPAKFSQLKVNPSFFGIDMPVGEFYDCIFTDSVNFDRKGNGGAFCAGCSFHNIIYVNTSATWSELCCAHLPFLTEAEYPGGLRASEGTEITLGGDSCWDGDWDGDTFVAADVQIEGRADVGSTEFCDGWHTIFPLRGGIINYNVSDPITGEVSDGMIWGTNNGSKPFLYNDTCQSFSQSLQDSSIVYSTVELCAGDGGDSTVFAYFGGSKDTEEAHAWDQDTATYTSSRSATWANVAQDIGSGGFQINTTHEEGEFGSFDTYTANVCSPGSAITILWEASVLTSP